jgi:hypothetical protein
MGYGTALTEIALGPAVLHETAHVTVFRTASHQGHLTLLIYATGKAPVSAQIAFLGVVYPTPPPFGGRLDIQIPLVPTLPEGPDVAVVSFNSTLGPLHLHYRERVHGRTVSYKPKGIPLPKVCPRGGFPFAARFSFLDDSSTTARTAVPCPSRGTD